MYNHSNSILETVHCQTAYSKELPMNRSRSSPWHLDLHFLHPLSVLSHRVDYSDTGNGGLVRKNKTKKQTNKPKKTRPTGGTCELLM